MPQYKFVAAALIGTALFVLVLGPNAEDILRNATVCLGGFIGVVVNLQLRAKRGVSTTPKNVFLEAWLLSLLFSPVFALLLGGDSMFIGQLVGTAIVIGAAYGGLLAGLFSAFQRREQSVRVDQTGRVSSDSTSEKEQATRAQRECPWCAERIIAKARLCKHCGRDVLPVTESDTAST